MYMLLFFDLVCVIVFFSILNIFLSTTRLLKLSFFSKFVDIFVTELFKLLSC